MQGARGHKGPSRLPQNISLPQLLGIFEKIKAAGIEKRKMWKVSRSRLNWLKINYLNKK